MVVPDAFFIFLPSKIYSPLQENQWHMDFKPEEINLLIASRRSFKPELFSSREVEKHIIEQMLENANWAPTHGLTQPWRFTVFSGDGRGKLAEFQSELYKNATPSEKFAPEKYEKLKRTPLNASHVIGIGMKRQESEKIPEIEEVEAVACAVQNMYLTARAYGVGALWGTGGVTYFEEAKEFFGLGPKDKFLGFLYVGYPKVEWPKGMRKTINERVRWVE